MRAFTGIAVVCLLAAGAAVGQVRWNELPLPDGTFAEPAAGFRSDVIEIPLDAGGELEYKLGLEKGASIVYQWQAVGLDKADLLYAEFHGHTEPVGGVGDLMYYRKASGDSERGTLTAPFTGIHGWYLRNDGDKAIVVRLTVAGFYELLPQ